MMITLRSVAIALLLAGFARADIIPPGGGPTPKTAGVEGTSPDVAGAIERLHADDLPGALSRLEAATRKNPALPPPRLMMARLLLATGRESQALLSLEAAVAEAPNHPGPHALLGDIALNQGRLSDAELQFQAARSLASTPTLAEPSRREALSSASAGLAGVAERRGRYAEALPLLTDWADRNPNEARPQLRLARVLVRLGRTDKARAHLDRASVIDASLDPPGITLGVFLSEADRQDEAARAMSEAVRRAPDDPRPRLGFPLWLIGRERHEEARAQAEAALAVQPGSSRARLLLGTIALNLGEFDSAEAHLEAAYRAAQTNAEAASRLAVALAAREDAGKGERALGLAEGLVRRSGGNTDALATLGRVQALAGRPADALATLRAASRGDRATPEVALALALALDASGRKEEARGLLTSAIAAPLGAFPSRAEAKRLLERWDAAPRPGP